jgi:hypothetical protein
MVAEAAKAAHQKTGMSEITRRPAMPPLKAGRAGGRLRKRPTPVPKPAHSATDRKQIAASDRRLEQHVVMRIAKGCEHADGDAEHVRQRAAETEIGRRCRDHDDIGPGCEAHGRSEQDQGSEQKTVHAKFLSGRHDAVGQRERQLQGSNEVVG